MKVATKFRIVVGVYSLLPISIILFMADNRGFMNMHDFQAAISLGLVAIAFSLLLCPLFGLKWMVLKQFHQIETFSHEIRNGNYIYFELPNQPLEDKDENELNYLKRNMNWMVMQINARESDLEQRVNARTAELQQTNIELQKAKDTADASVHAKNRFLANMSHEIRTPMNAIIGLNDLILKTNVTQKQKEYLEIIRSSSQSLLTIINDILDFSKIDAGQLDLENVPFAMHKVIEEVTDIFSYAASEKSIELIVDINPDVPPKLMGDPLRIRQVLINLVSNAVKFTHAGEICITVTATCKSLKTAEILIEVADTGIGMSEDAQKKVFNVFTQADNSTTRKYGGTGLGLAICKQLTDLMSGEISLESKTGAGSRFTIKTELDICQCDAYSTQKIPEKLKKNCVLIINNHLTIQKVVKRYLESFGLETKTANSADEALLLINDFRPNLLIIDSELSGKSSHQVVKKIRERMDDQNLPVIHTCRHYREENTVCTELKSNECYLEKPIKQSALFNAILTVSGYENILSNCNVKSACKDCQFEKTDILVVEDNAINQKVIFEILSSIGIIPDIVCSGLEAISAIKQKTYHLILMDIQMEGLDGYETVLKIRQNPKFKSLPILAMTANTMAEDRVKAIESGMNDHIGKPIDSAILCTKISRWTGHKSLPLLTDSIGIDPELIAAIHGVNVEVLMAKINGKMSTFYDLLFEFEIQFSATLVKIGQAIDDANMQEVDFLLHKLKGSSGNMSATVLYKNICKLEVSIKEHDQNEVNHLLIDCENELMAMINSIKNYKLKQNGGSNNQSTPQFSKTELDNKLLELKKLYEKNSLSAKEQMLNIKDSLSNFASIEDIKQLEMDTRSFDFESAQKTLAVIVGNTN